MTDKLSEQIRGVLLLDDERTPGNWGYDDGITDDSSDPPYRGKPQVVQGSDTKCIDVFGRLIADIYSGDDQRAVPTLAESDANGRFIAAAPTMASLLRECLVRLEAAEKDAQRLDFLEDEKRCYWVEFQVQPSGEMLYAGNGLALREAIDSAIASRNQVDKP